MPDTPGDIATSLLLRMVDHMRRRDLAVVELFVDDAVLFGSDADEVARGHDELRTFMADVYAEPSTFGWEWDEPLAGRHGDVVWFVVPATTHVISDEGGERTFPYRLSGVLVEHKGEWRFALFNGAEPAS